MNTLDQAIWLRWVVPGLVLAVFCVLIYVAWWALFADRPNGRRRCPRCWYDMSYSPGMTCPECGRTARSEKEFGRRRRHLGVASLAILGCVAIGGYVDYQVGLRDWAGYAPTNVLIWTMPYAGGNARNVLSELEARETQGKLSDEQWLEVLRRAMGGDTGAVPPSDAWIRKYGNFHVSWTNRRFRDLGDELKPAVQQQLLSMPLPIELDSRKVWPVGSPPVVRIAVRDRWWMGAHARCTARVRLPEAAPVTFVRTRRPIQQTSFLLQLPELPPGEHEIAIDFDLEGRFDEADPWKATSTQTHTLFIQVSDAADHALESITDAETDELIRATFEQGLSKWAGGGGLPVRVSLAARNTLSEAFDDTAVGVRVEVLRNGELGRILDIWWHAGSNPPIGQYAWHVPMWDDEVLGAPAKQTDEWMLRVRGLRELALRVDGVSRYWAGDVTIPVDVRLQSGTAPSRGWLREGHHDQPMMPLEQGAASLVVRPR